MYWLIVAAALALDQASKYLVASQMQPWQSIPLIENVFHLTYVLNEGAAWSILQGQRWLFLLITPLVLVVMLWLLRGVPKEDKLQRLAFSLFFSGALGNFIDRLRLGAVTDFFDFRVFPVFNVADSCIVVGVALLSWCLVLRPARPKEEL